MPLSRSRHAVAKRNCNDEPVFKRKYNVPVLTFMLYIRLVFAPNILNGTKWSTDEQNDPAMCSAGGAI